jgi:hypothetical protein
MRSICSDISFGSYGGRKIEVRNYFLDLNRNFIQNIAYF